MAVTSATGTGTPSPSTSFTNDCLLMSPFKLDDRLKASFKRLNSASVTENV